MPNKPKYIQELETKFALLEQSHQELRNDIDADAQVQQEILTSVTEIKICLKGTEFDKENGGLVKQVNQNTKCIHNMKRQQANREGRILALSGVITVALAAFFTWMLNKIGLGG